MTVHHSDDEAKEIWIKEIGVEESRIFKKGDKDNFWSMGDLGLADLVVRFFMTMALSTLHQTLRHKKDKIYLMMN